MATIKGVSSADNTCTHHIDGQAKGQPGSRLRVSGNQRGPISPSRRCRKRYAQPLERRCCSNDISVANRKPVLVFTLEDQSKGNTKLGPLPSVVISIELRGQSLIGSGPAR